MRISLIVAFIIAFFAIIFAYQNSMVITVSLGVWTLKASLAIIVLLTLVLGFIIGLLVSVPAILRRGVTASRRQKTIHDLEQELSRQTEVIGEQKRRIEFLEKNLPQGGASS